MRFSLCAQYSLLIVGFLNRQDPGSGGCVCFYDMDPMKPAFEFCTEIAHMRIMHSPCTCLQTEM